MKLDFEKIFFCTGARNHDLLKIFNKTNLKFEIDERAASFKALGLSKMSSKPVAICTTSGTAVSECLSAMLEAYYSDLKLVLITGDRPKKLHGTGAPQTIDHEALTRSCRRSFIELNISDFRDLNFDNMEFPVHINVLIDDTAPHSRVVEYHQDIAGFKNFLSDKKKPLFLFSHENQSMRPLIQKFSELNLTFYAESLSGGRDFSSIKTEKKLVELFDSGYFDSVIRIGHTPLSKVWRQIEKNPLPVFSFDSRNLPGLSFGEVYKAKSIDLLESQDFWTHLKSLSPYPIGDESIWLLDELIQRYPDSEISYFKRLNDLLDESSLVYMGNSLVIRFFELTQKKNLSVFGNRGVNGIDGQLATAIGLAMGTPKKVFCILGDMTTFYDLSSLKDIPSNLTLIIMNNKGGRIFETLKLDKRVILEHDSDFKKIALSFDKTYSSKIEDLNQVQILELGPSLEQSQSFLQEWQK